MALKKLLFSKSDRVEINELRIQLENCITSTKELSEIYAGVEKSTGCGANCMVTCAHYCENGCEITCSASCFTTCKGACVNSCSSFMSSFGIYLYVLLS